MGISDNWGTPAWLADIAHEVMGDIDLDPCSTEADNEIVDAQMFYTEEMNGLTTDWGPTTRVFCNPPGGKSQLVKAFWAKCVAHPGPVFWVGFNLGQLRYLKPSPLDYWTAIPRKRVAFRDPTGQGRASARYDNYVTFKPAVSGPWGTQAKFQELMRPISTFVSVD